MCGACCAGSIGPCSGPPAAPSSATRPRSPAGAPRNGLGSRGAAQRDAWICFLDESGVSLRPPVRRTWAPRGQTPIVRHHGHWKRASMAGICCYAPDGSRARLCCHAQPDSYNDHTLIEVLKQLRRFLRGRPATLIWDNLPSHHSRVMRDWLTSQRHWLQVEYLPAYAHDLDPVEGLTLLYTSSGLGRVLRGHVLEHGEDLASHIALQAPDDLGLGLALLGAPGQVVPGRLVPAQPDDDDPVQRGVGLPIPAAVEAMAGGRARGGLDW